jgi:hypothetical protein
MALGSAEEKSAEGRETDGAVLLELFTSEGCSSCPPADALLAQLPAMVEAPVIPLSFHVDYWDGLGWKDPYSSRTYTRRQYDYSGCLEGRSVYTPQLVVDGAVGFVGSDRARALAEIVSASARPKVAILLEAASPNPDSSEVSIEVRARPVDAESSAEMFLALTENGLASDVTRGENKGRRLAHAGVVRWMRSLGAWDEVGAKVVSVPLGENWATRRLNVVAWLQERPCGRVVGARSIALGASQPR